MAKQKIVLTNKELKVLPKCAVPWNGSGAVIVNKEVLKSICSELLEYRQKDGNKIE